MAEEEKIGRPPIVLTDEEIKEVERLSTVLSKQQIADYFGHSHVTMLEIEKRQPALSVAYKRGRSNAIRDIGSGLIEKARNGDTASQIFYLKTQAGWKETQVQEVEVKKLPPLDEIWQD